VEPVHGTLHTQTRQLVESRGGGDQLVLPAVSRATPHRESSFVAEGNSSLEPPSEPQPRDNPVKFTRKQARRKFGYKITRSRY